MTDRVKLFPALIVTLSVLFGLKLISVWTGLQASLTAPAYAQSSESEGGEASGDAAVGGGETEAEAAAHGAVVTDEDSEVPFIPSAVEDLARSAAQHDGEYSSTELKVLESLSKRREVLKAREREMDTREKLLIAAEARVDSRIEELRSIETRIEELLRQRDESEEAQLRSLVKVYERMKPKDAARIFETLDKDILLDVASRMKEQAIAGVLAQMTPASAQDLTERLASRLHLPDGTAGE